MRLDKYLQTTGIIKRRTLANEACKMGLVSVNGTKAKATKDINVGDVVNVKLAKREVTIKVLKPVVGNSIKKTLRSEFFEILYDVSKTPNFDDDFWNDDGEEGDYE